MRKEFADYLSCPISGKRLTVTAFEGKNGHIIAGLLKSQSQWYPIVNGIPRLLVKEQKTNALRLHQNFFQKFKSRLPGRIRADWQRALNSIPSLDAFLSHQKKTADSFSYEWRNIYKENDYERQNFFHFLSPFLRKKDFQGKITIDIGCGSGRFTKWAALSGAKVSFGSDLGETVEAAYQLTKHLPNICIVQADIYNMPFQDVFDIAYAIGVLHHLPLPKQGFARLPKVLKKGGKLLIWVYNRRGNARAIYFYEPLRALLKNLPKKFLFYFCYLPASAVQVINLLTVGLAKTGAKKTAAKMPFSYYANFPFNMKLNDAFDVLATPKSNYYFREEVESWYRESRLKNVRSFEHPEAGITCIAQL